MWLTDLFEFRLEDRYSFLQRLNFFGCGCTDLFKSCSHLVLHSAIERIACGFRRLAYLVLHQTHLDKRVVDLFVELLAKRFLGLLASLIHFVSELFRLLLTERNVFADFRYDFSNPLLRETRQSNAGEKSLFDQFEHVHCGSRENGVGAIREKVFPFRERIKPSTGLYRMLRR